MLSPQGLTPLHYACDRGYLDIVKLLIENGADSSLTDDDDQTALDLAEACEHENVIAYLNSLKQKI